MPPSDSERLRRIALVTRHSGALRSGVTNGIFAPGLIAALGFEVLSDAMLPRGALLLKVLPDRCPDQVHSWSRTL